MIDFLIGLLSSFLIAFLAYKKSSLNKSGFVGALVLGTGIYFFGGLWFSIIMVFFFISSSLLTKFKKKSKKSVEQLNEKSGNRDYMQVVANGGIGLIFSFLYYLNSSPIFLLAYCTSFAVATADTWASEIGVLSKRKAVNILNFKPLKSGMSGGVSTLGTSFAFLGSLSIALIHFASNIVIYKDIKQGLVYSVYCVLLGFIGCIIDSLLGASIQAQYYCGELDSITEKRFYKDKPNKLVKGISFINNDIVNLSSNLLSVLIILIIV